MVLLVDGGTLDLQEEPVRGTVREMSDALAVDVADEGSIGMEPAVVFDRGKSGGDGQKASAWPSQDRWPKPAGGGWCWPTEHPRLHVVLPGDTVEASPSGRPPTDPR